MYLGIVPAHGGTHHDPSACLVADGHIIAFVEQERMSRKKHATGQFPVEAIEECLEIGDIYLSNVDSIGLSRNYDNRKKSFWRLARRGFRSSSSSTLERLFDSTVVPVKQAYAHTNGDLRSITTSRLGDHFDVDAEDIPPINFLNHHMTHAASAFYPSGFDEALVVSLDNYGGHLSGGIYFGRGDNIETKTTFKRFNSLGRFYGDFTEYLGFRRSNGEGKVMGLAPYGSHNEEVARVVSSYYSVADGQYDVEELTFRKPGDAVAKLERDLGLKKRYWRDDIEKHHKDVAFHVQRAVEDIVTKVVKHHLKQTSLSNVCLAGGVALNCKLNKHVRELSRVDGLFVQPAANDAGGSIGASCMLSVDRGDPIRQMDHTYFGSSFDDSDVIETVDELKLNCERVDDAPSRAAERVAEGELVGWFQGRMEGGPRALGNRSILADPRSADSLDRVNEYVKHREAWRPFAPSLLPEAADRYLVGDISKAAHFMVDTYETTEAASEDIPAVLHPADQTTRPQVVLESTNPRYYQLIAAFEERTDIGVVLNTSFNDSGEPMVRTPWEAIRDFYAMGLDALFIQDVLLEKP